MPRTRRNPEEKFFSHVVEDANGCWNWTSTLLRGGYGRFATGRNHYPAHRWAYEFLIGEIPSDLECDHLCRNRRCVNPWHIDIVTHRENIARSTATKFHAQHDHVNGACRNGHSLVVYGALRKDGYLACKECARMRDAKRRAARC